MVGFKDLLNNGGKPIDSKMSQKAPASLDGLGEEKKAGGGIGEAIAGAVTGLLTSVAGGDGKGGAPNPFADFDPESYVGANLANPGGGGEGIGELIGGLMSLFSGGGKGK